MARSEESVDYCFDSNNLHYYVSARHGEGAGFTDIHSSAYRAFTEHDAKLYCSWLLHSRTTHLYWWLLGNSSNKPIYVFAAKLERELAIAGLERAIDSSSPVDSEPFYIAA